MLDPVDATDEVSGPGARTTDPDLDRLRRLIVAVEQERLDELERRLDDPDVRAEEISLVLPESVARAGHDGNRLSLALAPAVEAALTVSITKNRKHLAEALAPAMGPAIRRAIAETLRAMVDSFNQVLQHSLSARALRWRVEAWRTGRPFAEVLLSHSLVFKVEQVFLVHREERRAAPARVGRSRRGAGRRSRLGDAHRDPGLRARLVLGRRGAGGRHDARRQPRRCGSSRARRHTSRP